MKRTLSLMLAAALSAGVALAKDIKTAVFTTTPQMHCSNCEAKIKKNLRFERGVKDIVTSVPDQTVTVKYDADKTSVAKLIKAFESFGYTARELKKGEKAEPDGTAAGCNM